MTLATAPELLDRFGPLVDLETLASYFGTSLRALRPALRRQGVVTISIGGQEQVQLYVAANALGLERLDVLEDQADLEMRRRLLTHRADGTPRSLEEMWAVADATAL